MSQTEFSSLITTYEKLCQTRLPVPEVKEPIPPATPWPMREKNKKCALIFSPHPDDECLMGALPLRLLREENWQIINVAVTLGSKLERKEPRWIELSNACSVLGFLPLQPVPQSFTRMHREIKENTPEIWHAMAKKIAEILTTFAPNAIFFPHDEDLHFAHIATHDLVIDGLKQTANDFTCAFGETEYWHPNKNANCMIGIDAKTATQLLTALSCHVGENSRNPYNIKLPATLIDSARRGGELLSGRGTEAPPIDFAMMYRIGTWKEGTQHFDENQHILSPNDPLSTLLSC